MSVFRSRRSVLRKAIAVLTAGMIVNPAFAAEPIPSTYVDVPVPQLTDWNDINTQTVDGISGATGKTFIYPDQATRDADLIDWDTFDPFVDHYGVGSVGYIFWDLDDGSGRAPGLQVVTDDFDFPVNNCIMASGERESTLFPGTIVPKTCSDDEGSSKRYKLVVTEPDVPIDLVFDLGLRDVRYKGIKDPSDDGGEELAAFKEEYGLGRIYRWIQKIINSSDERWVSVKFEVGTGVGDAFVPLTVEDGVAFELRPLVPREFFEGETGAPDIEVWNPLRFATFSPKVYDDGLRRFPPGFFDDNAAGLIPPQNTGISDKSQFIDSGTTLEDGIIGAVTKNYFDIAGNRSAEDAPLNQPLVGNVFGYMLPTSLLPDVIVVHEDGNIETESDAIMAWWDGHDWRYGEAGEDTIRGTADDFGIVDDALLEQWATKLGGRDLPIPETDRYVSDVADDLRGLNTDAFVYIDDRLVDEATGELKLDSITLRITPRSVSAAIGSVPGSELPDWMEPGNEAPELASYMPADDTPVAINDIAATVETDPVEIDVLENDLFNGASLDSADVVSVDISEVPANGDATVDPLTFKVTYTADDGFTGVELFKYTVTVNVDDGLGGTTQVTSSAATVKVTVDPEPVPDAPIAANDSATTFEDTAVTLDVLANDELNNDAPTTVLVEIVDSSLNGLATVDGENNVVYTPNASFVGFDRFTYRVTVDGKVSNTALITIRVDEPVVVDEPKKSSSSGCSVGNANGPFDPMLPGMLLLALMGLFLRRRRIA